MTYPTVFESNAQILFRRQFSICQGLFPLEQSRTLQGAAGSGIGRNRIDRIKGA
jgi:hypothetical protein